MKKETHKQQTFHQGWARAKTIRTSHGLTAPQLRRYAEDGLIRTSHIRRPGQTRGVRLFNLADIEVLINASIENAEATESSASPQIHATEQGERQRNGQTQK